MTHRERYIATLLFEKPERIPFSPGWPRRSTIKAWEGQGLAPGRYFWEALLEELALTDVVDKVGAADAGVSTRMMPIFEEKVLEHKDGHYIVQDWMGAITEISDEFDYTYIRNAIDFVTRKWHKFPVETREDWERMKERYRLDTPGRIPEGFGEKARRLQAEGYLITTQVNGPFWQMREWCGFENLCMLCIEDPDFVQEMAEFWTEFVSRVLGEIHKEVILDRLGISEDMAYKAHSMISPAMTRQFLQPAYERWVGEVKAAGCPIIDMDSDGFIGELIPIWIDAGINACDPIEVAAHNDIIDFRRRFGTKMAYLGGVDKRAIAAGGDALKAEIARIAPIIKDGGYIPGCDHGVPPDISWQNYIEYSRMLARLTGWL